MSGRILVTGARGFIGQRFMESPGQKILVPVSLQEERVDEINYEGIDTIVHLAGIAHRGGQTNGSIYSEVNRDLTIALANMAKANGVEHFVFISTVKVYGDDQQWLDESFSPSPKDDYGCSKFEAEESILAIADDEFKVSILRPPLVYGPGVKGNLLKLMQWVSKGYPLPFKNISNSRSIVYVDNLVAMIHAIINQKAEGVFIAGDGKPLSTAEMAILLAEGFGSKARLFSLPMFSQKLLHLLFPEVSKRMFGSYVIDNSASITRLNFVPPYSTYEGLVKTAQWFKNHK